MNCTEVSILEERHQISLSSFLEGKHCLTLESDFLLELSGDLAHQSLEWKLPNQQVGLNESRKDKRSPTESIGHIRDTYALLEFSDLSQGNGSRFETVRFLHTRDDGGGLSGDLLGGQLFSWHFLCSTLAGGLLGTSHLQ